MSFRRHQGAIHESVFTKGSASSEGTEFAVIGPCAAHGEYPQKDDVGLQLHLGGFTFVGSISRDVARRLGELLIAAADDEIAAVADADVSPNDSEALP